MLCARTYAPRPPIPCALRPAPSALRSMPSAQYSALYALRSMRCLCWELSPIGDGLLSPAVRTGLLASHIVALSTLVLWPCKALSQAFSTCGGFGYCPLCCHALAYPPAPRASRHRAPRPPVKRALAAPLSSVADFGLSRALGPGAPATLTGGMGTFQARRLPHK